MLYVIAAACIDVMDRSCMEECPVDCIYEGGRLGADTELVASYEAA